MAKLIEAITLLPSVYLCMTISAYKHQIVPRQRDGRIRDVLWCQVYLVMYDCPSVVQTILKAFLAKSTLALNKSGTTVLPCRAFIESFCKVSHSIKASPPMPMKSRP